MVNERGPLARLLHHIEPHRSTVWLASLCSVLNKVFDLAPPLLIGAAVDVVVQREDSLLADFGVVDVEQQLVVLSVLTVVVWALESGFEYAYAWLWRNLAQTVQHELRIEAYRHIQNLDMAWFSEQRTGDLMAVLNDDINQLERFLDGGANDLIQVTTTAVLVGAAFVVVAPGVAVWAILPIPFILLGSFKFQSRIAPRYADVRRKVGHLSAVLSGNLSGIATIKSFVTEDHEVARVGRASEDYRVANRHAIRLSSAFSPLIRMVIVVGFVATLLVGGRMVLQGAMAVGTYSVLVFLTQRLLWPLTRLGVTFDLYQRAMASTERVLDLVDTEIEVVQGDRELGEVAGAVAFEDVAFAYPSGTQVLSGFALRVAAGRSVAVVGATGAGKTTLVRLLLRFFDPQQGRITVDGIDVRSLRLSSLRGAIAYVGQQTFLFPGTVRENVCYGTPDASEDDVREALAVAEALDFVDALPQGLDTQVGEHGDKLSGGQAQRLSIARAVLKDAPILVLDEATSAVDNETEAAIQRSIDRIAAQRTTILIAHRLSTVRNADEIVVLEDGGIRERGNHDSLVAAGGLYARLWAIQTGERSSAA